MNGRTQRMARGPRPAIALWIRAMDAATVTLVLVAALVGYFGGFRIDAGPLAVSVTAAWRLVALAVIITSIRHARVRTPSIFHRFIPAIQGWWASPTLGVARAHWAASRLAVLFAGYVAVGTIGYLQPPDRISENEFWNLPARGDALRVLSVAKSGYRAHPDQPAANLDLFPAYPLLMEAGGTLVGNRTYNGSVFFDPLVGKPLFAGMAISLAAFLYALSYLYSLARLDMGDGQAKTAVALLAAYPFAFIFSTPTAAAVALLAMTAAVYSMRMDAVVPAAAWGLLAGFSHPLGGIVSLPLAVLALFDRSTRTVHPGARFAAALMPVAGLLTFSLFSYAVGGRPFPWLDHGSAGSLRSLLGSFHVAAAALAAVVAVMNPRHLLLAYGSYAGAVLLVLAAGPAGELGPGTALLFPTFLALGRIIPPGHRVGWVSAFALGQGLFSVLFFTARPII